MLMFYPKNVSEKKVLIQNNIKNKKNVFSVLVVGSFL